MAHSLPLTEPGHNTEDAFAASVAEGMQAADEGRVVSYGEVRRWLLAWGTAGESLPPRQP